MLIAQDCAVNPPSQKSYELNNGRGHEVFQVGSLVVVWIAHARTQVQFVCIVWMVLVFHEVLVVWKQTSSGTTHCHVAPPYHVNGVVDFSTRVPPGFC